jgi:Mg-chelatase subunit ChlD
MRHSQTALERALPIVAAAYGQQFGVRVVLSGTEAYTDGESIVLPMLERMSERKDVLFGYLAHEAAHIRESDFGTLQKCKSPIEKCCTNIIEDIRIERLIQEVFPGTRFTLDAMWNYVIAEDMSPPSKIDQNEATQLLQYLLHRLRSEILGRTASDHLAQASQQVVEQTFPKGFFVRLDGLLGKYMDNLTCSDDCLKVARAILKALQDAEEEQESSSDSDNSQNADSQEPADEDDSGQGQDDSQSSDDADDSGESDQSDSSENSQSSGPSTHDRISQETDLPEDVINQLRGELKEQAQEEQAQKGSSDGYFSINTDIGMDVTQAQGDTSMLQAGILTSSVIRSRLVGMLQAKTRTSQRLHCRGRKVDGRRLSRLASGDSRVFIQRNDTKRPETSVHVLLDCSGSMLHQQDIANAATVSLALAISTIPQCDIAVSMFPGVLGPVSPMIKRGQVVRTNVERFAVRSSGSTPLAEGMLYAAKELSQSHKPRQVLIVITDGDPDSGSAVNYINGLIRGHITTYAIGIGSTAVERYFENWCVINDVKELQSALFDIASNFLELDI